MPNSTSRPGLADIVHQFIRAEEGAAVDAAAQRVPGQAANIRAIARGFGVPVSTAQRYQPHFENRQRARTAARAFVAAPAVRGFIAQSGHNLAVAAGQIPQLIYLEHTTRHAAASATRGGAAVVGGYGVFADAYHRIHRQFDPASIVTGRDMTQEGLTLRLEREERIAALPAAERAKAEQGPDITFTDITAPIAAKGRAFAQSIDIEHPDRFQRIVGDVAGALPALGAAAIDPLLGVGVVAAQGAGDGYEAAIAKRSLPSTARRAAVTTGLIDGGLALLPGAKLIEKLVPNAPGLIARTVRPYLTNALAAGALNASTQTANNAVAKATFDPRRGVFDGTLKSLGSGALLGSLAHAGQKMIGEGRPGASEPAASSPASRPLDMAVDASRATRMVRDNPEQAHGLLRQIAPEARVRIPVQPVTDYLRTLAPPEASRFLDETGIGGQSPDASHVETDLPTYLAVIARDVGAGAFPGAHEAFADHAEVVGPAEAAGDEPAPADDPSQAAGADDAANESTISPSPTPAQASADTSAPSDTTADAEPASPVSLPQATRASPADEAGTVTESDAARSSADTPTADTEPTAAPSPRSTRARADPPPPHAEMSSGAEPAAPPTIAPSSEASRSDGGAPSDSASEPLRSTVSTDIYQGLPHPARKQLGEELLRWSRERGGPDIDTLSRIMNANGDAAPAFAEPVDATPRRGVSFVPENLGRLETAAKRLAKLHEDGTDGALYDRDSQQHVVPALRYDNPNPNGKAVVKFDGYRLLDDGRVELIDAKTRVLTFSTRRGLVVPDKVQQQLLRQSEALSQNDGYLGAIEVPSEATAADAVAALRKLKIDNISVRVRASLRDRES